MEFKSVAPAGHRILVKPDKIEETSKQGIIIDTGTNKARKEAAQIVGTLIAAGPLAWKGLNSESNEPWASIGDRVLFAMYGGYEVMIKGEMHRIMNDEDVTGIVQEAEDE